MNAAQFLERLNDDLNNVFPSSHAVNGTGDRQPPPAQVGAPVSAWIDSRARRSLEAGNGIRPKLRRLPCHGAAARPPDIRRTRTG